MNGRAVGDGGSVLVLGGTSEARALATRLVDHGIHVVSSLAGRVREPRMPAGEVRVGGFGGPDGLGDWLREQGVRAVVDATHPFAERIGASAVAATRRVGLPLLRLERPGWQQPDGVDWHWVASLPAAAEAVSRLGERAFVTTGRQGLSAFAGLYRVWFLVRCVDPPQPPMPPRARILLARGPYTVDGEAALMRTHGIDVLVTKDSGGTLTAAKLDAAGQLGIPVVVVRRPRREVPEQAGTVDDAVRWVLGCLAQMPAISGDHDQIRGEQT